MAARIFALRPMLPDDAPALAEIFRAAVLDLAAEDYGEDQRDAWAARADDAPAFARRLAGALTLVLTHEGEPVAFASLEGADRIAMLYVAPDQARQGAATLLCDALERLAAARGAKTLAVDASDTAKALFLARGYVAQTRNMVQVEGEWLGNTTMERALAAAPEGASR